MLVTVQIVINVDRDYMAICQASEQFHIFLATSDKCIMTSIV